MQRLIIFCFIFTFSASAVIRLNINVINKKGIDKGLVLISELHAMEEIAGEEGIVLQMRNGPRLVLKASFADDPENYGPSDLVKITGALYDQKNKRLEKFDDKNYIVKIGKQEQIIYQETGQLIEISVLPEIR